LAVVVESKRTIDPNACGSAETFAKVVPRV
jgi:hypothetical protein